VIEQDPIVNIPEERLVGEPTHEFQQMGSEVDEKLDIEALAQMIEHLDHHGSLAQRLRGEFGKVRKAIRANGSAVGSIQSVLRDLMLDLALTKRALASLGQIGVMERRRIEKELIVEVFPPSQVRSGTGISVAPMRSGSPVLDCGERISLCKSACCRIFNVPLTPKEVHEGRIDWNPRVPYLVHKNRLGCVNLQSGDCSCSIYDSRPSTCSSYSCKNDKRIWSDYEKKILNPQLKEQLEVLGRSNGDGTATEPARQSAEVDELESTDTAPPQPEVAPPDFSKLREMIVPEPANKFVPQSVEEPDSASEAPVSCPDEAQLEAGSNDSKVKD
jgi:Fe-S-cluster containining protein